MLLAVIHCTMLISVAVHVTTSPSLNPINLDIGMGRIVRESMGLPGDTCYTWLANGMLGSVLTPEGKTVYFGYDALGRRVSKTVEGTVRRYGWDGNVLLHEWDISEADRPRIVTDDSGREVYNGTEKTENLVTWVYDGMSFTPVAKVTEDERYTIIHDYLGTPTQAYDSKGELVWEMVLDVYGEVNECNGDRTLIPFRYQGQYEDEETGMYYNRFRYYSPQMGMYISQDPIGLEGGNPTLYGYVSDTNIWLDVFGLFVDVNFFRELKPSGMGHHPIPRGHANQHGLPRLGTTHDSPSWYPYDTKNSNILHYNMHKALDENGVPFSGKFNGTQAELIQKTKDAYKPFTQKGYVKIPRTGKIIAENVTVAEAVDIQLEWNNKMPTCK